MKITDKITLTNEDNMQLMARYPDNYFDLAIGFINEQTEGIPNDILEF